MACYWFTIPLDRRHHAASVLRQLLASTELLHKLATPQPPHRQAGRQALTALKLASHALRSMSLHTVGSTAASQVTMPSMVAMLGWIMPLPLHMPPMWTGLPPMVTCRRCSMRSRAFSQQFPCSCCRRLKRGFLLEAQLARLAAAKNSSHAVQQVPAGLPLC